MARSAAAMGLSLKKRRNVPIVSHSTGNAKKQTTPGSLPQTSVRPTPQTSDKKRKIDCESHGTLDLENEGARKKAKEDEEKRLRTHRKNAPKTFLQKLSRAQSQRLGSKDSLREEIDIAGTTGNVYKVTIGRLPTCTCPDHRKGNECKHKIYALHTVLKARYDLQYQRALLVSELEEIFASAPPLPTDVGELEDKDGKRKPIEGECPICYMDLDEKQMDLVWCKAACGNNMHKTCFNQWAASQQGKAVRCVYCRADWHVDADDMRSIAKQGSVTEEGYINVASQLGLSRARDYSTYHQPWVRRNFGYS